MVTQSVLPATARVWVYQSNEPFKPEDIPTIQLKVDNFVKAWTSHNHHLTAEGSVVYDRFIVLMVDESKAGASGCSIDASVRFMQSIESEYSVDLFDRLNFAYRKDGEIKSANKEDFVELYRLGIINDDTIVFNNLVRSKGEFDKGWEVRLGDSWHKNFVG